MMRSRSCSSCYCCWMMPDCTMKDEACWLAGEAPEDDGVYACASAFLGNKTVDDTAVLVLKFPRCVSERLWHLSLARSLAR